MVADLYIGHAADDRVQPVVADSAAECARKATEAFNMECAASDISNWKQLNDLHRPGFWRFDTSAQWWDYASIHEVAADE